MRFGFTRGIPTGTVHVVEALGNSAHATRAIWRYVLDIDLTAGVRAGQLPVDHPLFLLAAEPRQLRFKACHDLLYVSGDFGRLYPVGTA